jgi:hypothetical protein
MKYLKKFLITEGVAIDELQSFCDNTLVELIDEGFKVVVNQSKDKGNYYHTSILLRKFHGDRNDIFYWSDYKDDIIPFIEYLYEKYDCDERISIIDKYNSSTQLKIGEQKLGYYAKTEIIKDLDSIKIDYLLLGIFFYVNVSSY